MTPVPVDKCSIIELVDRYIIMLLRLIPSVSNHSFFMHMNILYKMNQIPNTSQDKQQQPKVDREIAAPIPVLVAANLDVSNVLECGQCKKNTVSYAQAYTRSTDEPMTTFCECISCGYRWKVSVARQI